MGAPGRLAQRRGIPPSRHLALRGPPSLCPNPLPRFRPRPPMRWPTSQRLLADKHGDLGQRAAAELGRWLSGAIPFAHPEVLARHLSPDRLPLLFDAFWQVLPFGTGGRRGRVGYGANRLNPSTVAMTIQGHCNFLAAAVRRPRTTWRWWWPTTCVCSATSPAATPSWAPTHPAARPVVAGPGQAGLRDLRRQRHHRLPARSRQRQRHAVHARAVVRHLPAGCGGRGRAA